MASDRGGRVRTAVRRGIARGDSWVAVAALWAFGYTTARHSWALAIVTGALGLVFLVSAGDYCWRKGHAAARRGD